MNSFTGPQFAESINSTAGLPLAPVSLAITGMAAKSDSPQSIRFSPGLNCQMWVAIPAALIEKVDHLGKMTCQDHQHDYVRLQFVNPTTEEGKVYAALLQQFLPSVVPSFSHTTDATSFTGHPMMSWGWHPPHPPPIHIPPIHLPPIHLPDLTEEWKKKARDLAWQTAAQVDHARGSSSYCPRNEIRAALLALAATFLAGPPTPEAKIMGAVISTIAFTLPDEYCRQSGR